MALSERLNPSGECNTESNFAMDCSLLSTKTVGIFVTCSYVSVRSKSNWNLEVLALEKR